MVSFFRRSAVAEQAVTTIAPAVPPPVVPAVAEVAPIAVDLGALRQQATVSAAASEAGTSIGWITHDAA
jgi:hypothetical protein